MALFDDTRADWGARAPQGPIYTVPIASRTEKFAHWNGGPLQLFGKPHSACLAEAKAIQAEHMHDDPDHNWSDIGYNGLICPHARAIEGRGRDAVGAHCPNHNRTGVALQFMVGKGQTATPAMFARAARFFADCETAARHTLKPMGHRDGFATECPGDQVELWVKAGMPGATTTVQEDEVTPDDIKAIAKAVADEAWTRPVDDGKGGRPTTGAAIGLILRNSIAALTEDRAGRAALLAAVKAGQDAGPQADADAIVDALATRLTQKETTP